MGGLPDTATSALQSDVSVVSHTPKRANNVGATLHSLRLSLLSFFLFTLLSIVQAMLQLIKKHGQKLGGRAVLQTLAEVQKVREGQARGLEEGLHGTLTSSEPVPGQAASRQLEDLNHIAPGTAPLPSSSRAPAQSSSVLGPMTPEKLGPVCSRLFSHETEADEIEEARHLPAEQQDAGDRGPSACFNPAASLSAELQASHEPADTGMEGFQASAPSVNTPLQQSPPIDSRQTDELAGASFRAVQPLHCTISNTTTDM